MCGTVKTRNGWSRPPRTAMGPFVRALFVLSICQFAHSVRSLADTPIDPMHVHGDHWQGWVALILCSYVVGMQMVGEIQDTTLCKIAMDRNIKELPVFWQYALGFLNRLRSQFFLQPLVGAIPCVVLTQGGSALDICFNTIAVSGTAQSHPLPPSYWKSDPDNNDRGNFCRLCSSQRWTTCHTCSAWARS